MTIANQLVNAFEDYKQLLAAWETEIDQALQTLHDPEKMTRLTKQDGDEISMAQQVQTAHEALHTLLNQIEQLKNAAGSSDDTEHDQLATILDMEQTISALRQKIGEQEKNVAELRKQASRHSAQTLIIRQERILAYRLAELVKLQRDTSPDAAHIHVRLARQSAIFGLRQETKSLLRKALLVAQIADSHESLVELLEGELKTAPSLFRESLMTLLAALKTEFPQDSQYVEHLAALRGLLKDSE